MQGIPLPLKDRMEIINITGYTEIEVGDCDTFILFRDKKGERR